MIIFGLILWGIFTALAWKKGWKEKSLRPFGICFIFGFLDGMFEWAITGTPLNDLVSFGLFAWLIYMTFTKPKSKPIKED